MTGPGPVTGRGRVSARRSAATAVAYTVLGALPPYLVSALAVQLQRDLGFDRTHLGWCISAFFVVSSVASARLGPFVERAGPAAGLRVAAACSLASLLGIALAARSWVHVALLLAVGGLANGFAQVSSNLALADHVPASRQGLAFGLKQSAIPLSSLLAGLALPTVGLAAGWRATMAALAVLPVPALLRSPRLPRVARPGRGRGVPHHASLLLLAAAGAAAGGTSNALAAFTVDASVTAGLAEATGGLLLAAGSGVAIAMRVLAGHLADRGRGSGHGLLAALMLAGACGFALLAAAGHNAALFVAGVLVGFTGGWGWQGLTSLIAVRRHPDTPAAASGLVFSGVYVGTIAGPPLIGHVATAFSYRSAWLLAGCLMAAGGALVLVSRLLTGREAARHRPERTLAGRPEQTPTEEQTPAERRAQDHTGPPS